MGPEKASLGRAVWKFQRTRVLMDIVANILCIITASIGPVGALALLLPCLPGSQTGKECHWLFSLRSGGSSTLLLSLRSLGANFHKANPLSSTAAATEIN